MTRQKVLQTINEIAESEIHDKSTFKKLESEEQTLTQTGIDSFDFIMLYMKLGEHFGIDNKEFKEKLPEGDPQLSTLIDFILECSPELAIG